MKYYGGYVYFRYYSDYCKSSYYKIISFFLVGIILFQFMFLEFIMYVF